jgi:hypothetical protein
MSRKPESSGSKKPARHPWWRQFRTIIAGGFFAGIVAIIAFILQAGQWIDDRSTSATIISLSETQTSLEQTQTKLKEEHATAITGWPATAPTITAIIEKSNQVQNQQVNIIVQQQELAMTQVATGQLDVVPDFGPTQTAIAAFPTSLSATVTAVALANHMPTNPPQAPGVPPGSPTQTPLRSTSTPTAESVSPRSPMQTPLPGTPIVENGGFEEGSTDSWDTQWSLSESPRAVIEVVEFPQPGQHVLHITPINGKSLGRIFKRIEDIQMGEQVHVRVWVYIPNAPQTRVRLRMHDGSPPKPIQTEYVPEDIQPNTWIPLTLSYPETTTGEVVVALDLFGTGPVYLDNVEITRE